MIEYMGRRCHVCRARMYGGYVLGPPDVEHQARYAYHPACLPDADRRLLEIYKSTVVVARNARRRLRHALKRSGA